MAKYYNADTLLNFVKENTPHINGETTMECVEKAIKEAPTADVVEVVRCSECKHCWHHVPDYTDPDRTDEVWECVKKIVWVEPDHFCSYGQRK